MKYTSAKADFEKKHQEDLERIRAFRLLDDDFMCKVFEDKICVQFLQQIVLDRNDLIVCEARTQYGIDNPQGRSVRLDIYAADNEGCVFNIEIQRSDKGVGCKRARYNSSLMDANITVPGEQYENLAETGEVFDDKAHIIYVNSQIRDETELGKLMHDFACTDAKKMHYAVLEDRVRYFNLIK